MRALIVIAAIVLILALVGWIKFSSDPSRSSINLETDVIKQDTKEAMESGARLLDDAEEAITPSDSPADSTAHETAPIEPTEPAPQPVPQNQPAPIEEPALAP